MIRTCSNGVQKESDIRVLQQAARELLLAQSSDWSFILRAGTTTDLAKERINRHLKRFWLLIKYLGDNSLLKESDLIAIETEDNIFPLIQANDWYNIKQ